MDNDIANRMQMMTEAGDEIAVLRIQLAAARARSALWYDIATQAQDKADALQEKLYAMELRCDCS